MTLHGSLSEELIGGTCICSSLLYYIAYLGNMLIDQLSPLAISTLLSDERQPLFNLLQFTWTTSQ